jgi:hypothetical protein
MGIQKEYHQNFAQLTAVYNLEPFTSHLYIEISFDEIKTHQCASAILKGQMPTIFRSTKAELFEQELYGMLIAYNLLRDLMYQAAEKYDKDPLFISFLESLQLVIDVYDLSSMLL